MKRISRLAVCGFVAAAAFLGACGDGSGGGTGPDPVAAVKIELDTVYLRPTVTRQLAASAQTASGAAATGATFTWTSGDTSVAAVSAEGLVTARKRGRTTVTASVSGKSDTATVWVTGDPAVTVISGAGVEDTIGTVLPAPLVVEARDSLGMPLVNTRVSFTGVDGFDPTMRVALLAGGEFTWRVDVVTDAAGRASVRVAMGPRAGPGTIEMRIAQRPRADSASYVVRPGAPAELRLSPADTAVFAGRGLSLRSVVRDRRGNLTAGTVAYEVRRGPVSVNAGTGAVSTSAYGTGWVMGRVGLGVDSVRVASVPQGAYAAGPGVVMRNFDGTGYRTLVPGTRPSWSPTGDRLVYQSNTGDAELITGTPGGTGQVLPGTPPGAWIQWAQYSPDGQWIYFCTVTPNEPRKLWRIRPDGAGLQMLLSRGLVCYPTSSPDGTRIAFSEEGVSEFHIKVRNLATGEESGVLALGNAPSWSPTGELIAFTEMGNTGLTSHHRPVGAMVMRPDGSGLREVGQASAWYEYSPRWSPDGRWLIVATAGGRIHLIEVATGITIELPQWDEVDSVSWKPGGLLP